MFNDANDTREVAPAVWAFVTEPLSDQFLVFSIINLYWPALADTATQLVQKHANQLVRDVRFGSSRGGT